jgi:hypothetical protein
MEDVNVPHPNPFITQWLVSAECRALMFERGEIAEALYREAVSKRTGRLAASTHVATEVEGDRWVSMRPMRHPRNTALVIIREAPIVIIRRPRTP